MRNPRNMRAILALIATGLIHCGAPAPVPQTVHSPGSAASLCSELCACAPSFARPATAARTAPAIPGVPLEGSREAKRPALVAIVSPMAMPSWTYAPYVIRLSRALQSRSDAAVFLIVAGGDIDSFIAKLPAPERGRIVRDADQSIARAFGTKQYPETWLIDGAGLLRARWDGEAHFDLTRLIRLSNAVAAGGDCGAIIDPGGAFTDAPPVVSGRAAQTCRAAWPK